MCGIVGFIGNHQAAPILLDGLSKLEYRGYDSAGLAVRDGDAPVQIVKAKGRLKALAEKTNDGEALKGTCGIGHTRWATHGEPSETNAHPHCSDDGNVVGVHNGIIENYQELRDKLVKKGYTFYSSTDTEVAVKLIDYYYKKYEGTPVDAINHSMVRIRGSYALAVIDAACNAPLDGVDQLEKALTQEKQKQDAAHARHVAGILKTRVNFETMDV